jgi:hypothetical protein
MAEITAIKGLEKLIGQLRDKAAKASKDEQASVAVGYSTNYALFVHEMTIGKPNPPRSDAQRKAMFASIREREKRGHVSWAVGQPKFLEQPFRELGNHGTLAKIISTALSEGKTMGQALLLAGLRVQRESQKLCPVDTGTLKNSAFTELETMA